MARPDVGGLAEETYADVDYLAFADEDNGWPLLAFLGAVLDRVQDIADLARDSDTHPGWGKIVDPDEAPEDWLPWTAQLVGVVIPPPGSPGFSELDEAGKRLRIKETSGQKRGTVAAIGGAARQYLTGAKTVYISERHGSAYRLSVATQAAETPDPAKVLAALLEQKPAGIVLTYTVLTGETYDDLEATHVDYTEVLTDFDDYTHVLTDPTHT